MRLLLKLLDGINAVAVAGGILASVLFLYSLSTPSEFEKTMRKAPGSVMDFRVDYVSGQLATSNERDRLYDPEVQDVWFRKIASFGDTSLPTSYFPYTPLFLLITIPLSMLSLSNAFLAWTCGGWLGMIAGLASLRHHLHKSSGLALPVVAGCLASLPAARCLVLGQMSYLFVAMLSAFFQAIVRRQDWLAGAMLAATAIKPQVFVFFCIPLLALSRWKSIGVTVLCGLLALAVVAVVASPSIVLSYPSAFISVLLKGHTSANPQEMVCIRGLLSGLLPSTITSAVTWLAAAGGMAASFWAWKRHPITEATLPWLISFTVLLYVVTGPHVHLYDCLLLSICALCSLRDASFTQAQNSRGVVRYWSIILLCYPLAGWLLFLTIGDEGPWLFRVHTMLNVLLLGFSFVRLRSTAQEPPVPQAAEAVD